MLVSRGGSKAIALSALCMAVHEAGLQWVEAVRAPFTLSQVGHSTRAPCPAQAEVFEEIATMEFPFEGIPTVPPRKDMDHMVR